MKLKQVLEEKGMSAYRVAEEFNKRKKISHEAVYGWVRGRGVPCADNLKILCEILNCSSQDLLGF